MRSCRRGVPHLMIAVTAISVLAFSLGLKPLVTSSDAHARGHGVRYRFKRVERCLMQGVNRARARRDLAALRPDKQLGFVARGHATKMAQRGAVFHDPKLERKVTRWRILGENSGAGRGCSSLTRSFLASPSHREQILGPFRFQGIGVVRGDGRLYVEQIFEARRDPGNIYNFP